MKQNNQPKSANGQRPTAEQITEAKARQRADALKRSQIVTRRTSGASISNSQVTERPPQVYQAPQINVPENLHDTAQLIHDELGKIAQSQSVLMTLWEQLKGKSTYSQTPENGRAYITPNPDSPTQGFEFGAAGTASTYLDFHMYEGDSDYAARLIAGTPWPDGRSPLTVVAGRWVVQTPNANPVYTQTATRYLTGGTADAWASAEAAPFNLSKYAFESTQWTIRADGVGAGQTWSTDMNYAPTGCSFFAYGGATNGPPVTGPCLSWYGINAGYSCQLVGSYVSGGALHFRTANGDGHTWNQWHTLATTAALEEMRAALKLEIYAELATIGIVIPPLTPGE